MSNNRILATLGVIGGFGPQSSAEFLLSLFAALAKRGCNTTPDFPRVVYENVPTAPAFGGNDRGFVDRNKTIEDVGRAIGRLERQGADFIAIPCNSLFAVFDELKKYAATKILHIADRTVIASKAKQSRKLLLLATTTTIINNVYHSRLKTAGIECVVPTEADQHKVEQTILNVFRGVSDPNDRRFLIELIGRHQREQSIDGVILGCTELPLIISQIDVSIPLFDSLKLYVEATADTVLSAKQRLWYDQGATLYANGLQDRFVNSQKPPLIEEYYHAEEKLIAGIAAERILDAGCGDGRHLRLMAPRITSGIGIDNNPNAINIAKRLSSSNRLQTCLEFYEADITDIPFPYAMFDTAICMNHTVGNLPRQRLAVKDMLRVLRPGGRLLFTVHGQEMIEDKLQWYRSVGLNNPRWDAAASAIITNEGFYSYCYTEQSIRNLCTGLGRHLTIQRLTSASFRCEIEK